MRTPVSGRRLWCVGLVAILVSASRLGAPRPGAAAVGPGHREAQLPKEAESDSRLTGAITVWEQVTTVRELLAQVSAQQPVSVGAADQIAKVRVTAYARGCRLRDALRALAEVTQGRWEARQSQEGTSYLLVQAPSAGVRGDVKAMIEDRMRDSRERENAAARPDRAARLELYRSSLSLTREDLLAQFEASDPWLCVDLLGTRSRGMVAQVCALSGTDREALLREGQLALPLRRLPESFQHLLAVWVTDTRQAPRGQGIGIDVDGLPRFLSPEERWRNSLVQLYWHERGLLLSLDVPDVYRFDMDTMHMPLNPPLSARQALVSLGVRKDSPEYREAAKKEQEEWAAAHPEAIRPGGSRGLPHAFLTRPPDEADPRCQNPITLDAGSHDPWTAAQLLEQVAQQCQVGVIASYVPADFLGFPRRQIGELKELTLGKLINEIRVRRGGACSWAFHGGCVAVFDADYPLIEASTLPQGLERDLAARATSAGAIPLEELAGLAASLNPMQVGVLRNRFGALQDILFYDFSLYGSLSPEQRSDLRAPRGLAIKRLTPEQRMEVLAQARGIRPWLADPDLSNTVLRTIARRLATGEDGISFITEYHFPDSPNDRDVLFTLPLQVPLLRAPSEQQRLPLE